LSLGTGDSFQAETKYCRNKRSFGYLDWSEKPESYKEYEDVVKIKLPAFEDVDTLSFDEVSKTRKSVRSFSDDSLGLDELSYLLWACTGIQRVERGYEFRTTPSAGALYPIETYLFAKNIAGLTCGFYHYNIKLHSLEELKVGDFSEDLMSACLGQKMVYYAPVVFVWSGLFGRSKWKYKQRAYRYVYLDCGHIGQSLALGATSLGLGSCQIGAFFDDEINDLLGLDGVKESVIYLSVVGHKKR